MGAPLHEIVAAMSQIAAGTLFAAIWQGILLAAAAGLGLRLLTRTPPAVRFAIWFAVFGIVAALPVVNVLYAQAGTGRGATGSGALVTLDERWCLLIGAVWLAASLLRAATLAGAAWHVRTLWKRARPLEETTLSTESVPRHARVCVSDEVDRPTVIGFFAPRIVVPEWLVAKLTAGELEQIVLHEAGHLSRADDWLNLLQKIALVVFPLNPVLAWVERRLCFERELACDERVLRATSAPKSYAECLATLAGHRLEHRRRVGALALALGVLGRESELGKRVRRILSGAPGMKPGHARLVLSCATLALIAGATELARSPQLVGFSHAPSVGLASATKPGDFRAVEVRAAVAPVQQWRTAGDAAPSIGASRMATRQLAQRQVRVRSTPVMAQAFRGEIARRSHAFATDVVAARGRAMAVAPQRTMMSTGPQMIVTRWVAVESSDEDGNSVVRTVTRLQPIREESRPYAAVAVQGGWLIFQL